MGGCSSPAGTDDDDSFIGQDETGKTDDDSAVADDDSTPPADDDSTAPDDDTLSDDDSTPPADDDTTPPVEDPVVSLVLLPSDIAVDLSTPYPLLAVAETASGRVMEWAPADLLSDNELVATVDASALVTPVAEGEALMSVTLEGLTSSARVRVIPSGTLWLHAVDAQTGADLPGVSALIGSTEAAGAEGETDDSGRVSLSGAFAGRVTVTLQKDGYVRASAAGAAAREQRIPLRPVSPPEEAWGSINGTLLWPGDLGGDLDLVIGLTAAGFQGNPVMYNLSSLLGQDREVTLYGLDVELPGNIAIKGYVDGYRVPSQVGTGATWGIAGAISLSDAVDIASAPVEEQLPLIVSTLSAGLGEMRWGMRGDLTVAEDPETYGADLAPSSLLSEEILAVIPLNPLGTAPEDIPLTMALAEAGEAGWILAGLTVGSGEVSLLSVESSALPEDCAVKYVAVIEAGGMGTGGDISAIQGEWNPETARVEFPAFLDICSLTPPAYVLDWTWSHTLAPGADLYASRLEARLGSWDVYSSDQEEAFALDDVQPRLGMDQVRWYLHALEVGGASFESLLNEADGGLEEVENRAERQSGSWLFYHAETAEE